MVEAEEEVRAMVTLYTIDCPKCKILEKKLADAGIEFEVCKDVELMTSKGFDFMPVLEVNGNIMNSDAALRWVAERGQNEKQ